MPYPIERKLVVAVSSRAIFDMQEANKVFDDKGTDAYRKYQLEHINKTFEKGVAFPFVRRLLRLNELYPAERPVEVVVLSRNSPDTGQRFFRSCKEYGLDITRGAFLSGQSPHPYIKAFHASLFLSANKADVISATSDNLPAGLVLPSDAVDDDTDHELRIAFDFDGVLADDASEKVFQNSNLELFHENETTLVDTPHDGGPLKDLFLKIGYFQKLEAKKQSSNPGYKPALRVAIVTARNAPSNERVVTTLASWGFDAAELFLMGGIEKKHVLKALKPHIFFDDQLAHLEPSADMIPSVLIPFGITNAALYKTILPPASDIALLESL